MLKNGDNLYRKQDVLEVMILLSGGIPIPNEIYVLKGKVDAMRVAFSVYLCIKE